LILIPSAAKLHYNYSTQRHEANTKFTKIKNKNNFNLLLCSLWFLGAFVFKDFFAKKNKDLTCNIIMQSVAAAFPGNAVARDETLNRGLWNAKPE